MVRWSHAPDHPSGITPPAFKEAVDRLENSWGTGVSLELSSPSMLGETHFRRWAGRLERHSCPPGAVRDAFTLLMSTDLRNELGRVSVPTLVLHRSGDRMVPVEHGRHLAACIPGARYVELDGDDHLPFVGDQRTLVDELAKFLGTSPRRPRPHALSDAEREVADLVVLGLTNAQVARRLYISRHTVDARLRRIFAKLGVANRTELAALAPRIS